MSKVALYRHYRSKDFDELVGQQLVASTLEKALTDDKLSHAYLFTGPRGVGKTSAARILARRVNEIEDARDHPDVIEIDAASNNGVEEIRDLREKVHIAPNFARYKVYIIDEVHMLSNAAFNALLKTLEEPPSHVIFVLATTEPHKLPQTIISRTQHFPFRPITRSDVAGHLLRIASSEKISIDEEAAELIADLGEGSMRDSISLLDQLSTGTNEKITLSYIQMQLGLAHSEQISQLFEGIAAFDIAAVLSSYDQLLADGVPPQLLLKQLLLHARSAIRAQTSKPEEVAHLSRIMRILSRIPPGTANIEFSVEAALLEAALPRGANSSSKGASAKSFQERIPASPTPAPPKEKKSEQRPKSPPKKASKPKAKKVEVETPKAAPATPTTTPQSVWVKTLSIIKQQHASLFGLLKHTEASIKEEVCELEAKFVFHHRRLNESQNQRVISAALNRAAGKDIKLVVKPLKKATAKKAEAKEADESDIDVISQVTRILGGEVANG